jgi:NAD(P)-dependent dehydrogenase (short-subunit alcohol dehydrogenase family)
MTIVVTGAASGMGAATAARLRRQGDAVLGVDLASADVNADLGTPVGRNVVIAAVADREVSGVVTFAGVSGFADRPGSLVVSVNYFGTVVLLEALLPALARTAGAAVAISSNTATTAPNVDDQLVEALLHGDEEFARRLADELGGPCAYSSSKLAVARWVRRVAPSADWAGAGVRLNAIAPGYVETALTHEMLEDPATRRIIERMPLPIGRPGTPDDIAALAALLLGSGGSFFVGSVLFVDGGTDALIRGDDWPTSRHPHRATA